MPEYVLYFLAATGAGIGTGLAGLSAATVMVPILIVLCPSFAGEYGPYQATAIALASDILGSAVTSATYARNKKIDLRHGWIMLICIVSLSTAGSYAAYLAGGVVLGGFTLILTLGIGIRFLVKPDTSKEDSGYGDAKLDTKGILISVFFGLTIGFGTGFVGTGGGMMMLVVFTAFLGYERKTAVGTSTFIMTFTALIAFISHVLIHPAIVMDRWNILLFCMATATVFSLISAQFANRVNNRTVGLVTGAVLTVLGVFLIYLNYFAGRSLPPFVSELFHALYIILLFLLAAVAAALILFFIFKVNGEPRRKTLHVIALLFIPVMVLASDHWYTVIVLCLILGAVIYPLLKYLERFDFYASLFQERRTGEVINSFLLLFFMGAAVTVIFWGIFGSRITVVASILAWGIGDGAAALIGMSFGKHKIGWCIADRNKSCEGSAAMFCADVLLLILLLLLFGYGLVPALILSVPTALSATFAELVTKKGYDTVTVPLTAAAVFQILITVIV